MPSVGFVIVYDLLCFIIGVRANLHAPCDVGQS